MTAFFAFLLMMYAKGPEFDFEGAENNLLLIKKEPSKAVYFIIALILLFVLNKNRISLKVIANYKLWGVYILVVFILVFLRGNILENLYNFGNFLFGYLIFAGILRFVYRIKFHLLEYYFILISVIILILCLIFHLLQGHHIVFFPDRSINLFERLGGMFYYAHTSAIAAITLLLSLIRYFRSKKKFFLIISVFCLMLLIATDTRSAWVATAFSLLFIFFKNVNFYKLLLFCIGIYILALSYSSYLQSSQNIRKGTDDSEFRIQIWGFSLNLASKRLFTGYGNEKIKGFSNFTLNDNLQDPHNSIISLLLQNGVISIIIYFVIYFKNCNLCNERYNSDYRFLYFFWLFFPFFWGNLYNNLSNFINIYIMFTIYAFTLNPNIVVIENAPLKNKRTVYQL